MHGDMRKEGVWTQYPVTTNCNKVGRKDDPKAGELEPAIFQ